MAHIPRALVVEDDARMRRIVAKVLTGCGVIVRAAGDGVEALNAFRASREEPELICADIRMPNMDGREFARRLRHEGVDVPIIFVSGTIPKDQEGYREKSHVYLVAKPFSPNDLTNIVKEMLAKPRPKLGARTEAAPLASAADLSPLPSGPGVTTPGFSQDDFPKKAKSSSIIVPQASDRPFGGVNKPAAPAAPAAPAKPATTAPPAKPAVPAKPAAAAAPAKPAAPAAPAKPAAAAKPAVPAKPAPAAAPVKPAAPAPPPLDPLLEPLEPLLEPLEPLPVPQSVQPEAPAAPPRRKGKKAHETTMIFLKPISAREVPKSGRSILAPRSEAPAKPPAPVAPPAPPAALAQAEEGPANRVINVERRIREPEDPALRKPGEWVPRLIIWPGSMEPDALRHWCDVMAAALGSVQSAGKLEAFALAAAPSIDASGRRWRVKAGVHMDGQLFQAILGRKLRGLFLLAPKALQPNTLDRFLSAEHLDRSNVLTLGALLVDFDCAGRKALAEITFQKEEASFLHALNKSCADGGCSMRRAEWKPK